MFFTRKPKLKNVLVCIGKNINDTRLVIPFIDDLVLYFVEDRIEGFSVVTEKDLKKLKLSEEELLEIGKENVKNKIYSIYDEIPIIRNDEDEIINPFDIDEIYKIGKYNFWTSIILIKDFWNKESELCIEKNWEKYYIAMPYRTCLLIGNANNRKSKDEIMRVIKEYKKDDKEELFANGDFEAARREISDKLFIMDNGNLSKLD